MSTVWLNSDGKLVIDATSGKAIICATCPCACVGSDDFTGSGTNSGSVGDTNWSARWTNVQNDGSTTITSNQLVLSVPASSGVDRVWWSNCYTVGASTDFTISANVDWTGLDVTVGSTDITQYNIRVTVGSAVYGVVVGKWGTGLGYPSPYGTGTGYDFQISGVTSNNGASLASGTTTLKIERVGNTTKGYVGATSYTFSTSNTGAVNAFTTQVFNVGSVACSAKVNNVVCA